MWETVPPRDDSKPIKYDLHFDVERNMIERRNSIAECQR